MQSRGLCLTERAGDWLYPTLSWFLLWATHLLREQGFSWKKTQESSRRADNWWNRRAKPGVSLKLGIFNGWKLPGAVEHLIALFPKRIPKNGVLSRYEENCNKNLSFDRIVVENFFGRMRGLWSVFAGKWKRSETRYDSYFRLGFGLKYLHIRGNPLRADDYKRF